MSTLNLDPSRVLIGWLVRHGELKNMRIWDGWGDFDLSPEGHKQAEKAAQYLSYERIGRVISSDVPRTLHTAEYIMNECDIACPFLYTDPNIRPWMVADFTGKEKTPALVAEFQKYIANPKLVIPGGESRELLNQRVLVVPGYLASPYDGKPTVVVLHNSVIKSLMGLDDIKEAVDPGGIIAVYSNAQGECEFQVVLGAVELEKGVS